jgi:hypothetical protein
MTNARGRTYQIVVPRRENGKGSILFLFSSSEEPTVLVIEGFLNKSEFVANKPGAIWRT